MLTLYGCPNTRSARAAWALEEVGADYDYVKVNLFRGEGRKPDFLARSPGGKVPLLEEGELRLCESGAILIQLAERFPAAGLLPGTDAPAARAACLQWCCFALTELEQPLWTIAKHRFALPQDKRVAQMEDTARWEFARAAKVLAAHLGQREFCVGDRFSIADILLAHCIMWARSARVPVEPATLDAYADRLWQRPARMRAEQRERA